MKTKQYLIILLGLWIAGLLLGFFVLQRGEEDQLLHKFEADHQYQMDRLTAALNQERDKVFEMEKLLNQVRNAPKPSCKSEAAKPQRVKTPAHVAIPQVATPEFAVIVFTYKRAQYLKRCLQSIFKYLPKNGKYQVFVSQDGKDPAVEQVVRSFKDVTHFQKDHNDMVWPKKVIGNRAYYYISQHFKFGLSHVFDHANHFERVIILEEDIEVAPDFFELMEATSPLLSSDPSLFCVSAFNDNGMPNRVKDPMALYRSDFFPGLGWMMARSLWNEIGDSWALGYWDDWLRLPKNRKQRACIRPEISRTFTFGAKGVSQGQFYNKFLKNIHLGSIPINWPKVDLSYLKKDQYDRDFEARIKAAIPIAWNDRDRARDGKDYKIIYKSIPQFDQLVRQFHLMTDKKSGVPRGAYRAVLQFRHLGGMIFIVPANDELRKQHMGLKETWGV